MPYSLYIYKFPSIFINSGKNELENKIQSLVGPNFCCHFFCHCNMILLFNTGPQPCNIHDLAYCCKDATWWYRFLQRAHHVPGNPRIMPL